MKRIQKATMATLLAVACCAPLSASSDYGLVVKVTNKLIDNVQLLEADVATLRSRVEAAEQKIAAVTKERDEALAALEGQREKSDVNARRIMDLEASIDMLGKKLEAMQPKADESEVLDTEVLRKQEERLKAYMQPEPAK